MTGNEIMESAIDLVIDALRSSQDGLTNTEVIDKTGLYLSVPDHSGYITWTILMHLVQKGRVVKNGKLYRFDC